MPSTDEDVIWYLHGQLQFADSLVLPGTKITFTKGAVVVGRKITTIINAQTGDVHTQIYPLYQSNAEITDTERTDRDADEKALDEALFERRKNQERKYVHKYDAVEGV